MAQLKPQHRPAHDMNSPMLQIVDGCTHGKCHFCGIYVDQPFCVMSDEKITEGIEDIARTATALTYRIYLTGGNPFALPNKRLIEVFDQVEARIPTVHSYGGFCRITDIAKKTDEELRELAQRGVNHIAIGAESGDDELLAFMEKGQTSKDLVSQAQRLHEAGIDFTFFYLAGLAGAGKTQEAALKSARVFSEAAPETILIVTLTPTPCWPLAQDIAEGTWAPATEVECAREIQTFIAHLTCPTKINCSHDTDILRFQGILPGDKDKINELMETLIPKMSERASRLIRESIHKTKF